MQVQESPDTGVSRYRSLQIQEYSGTVVCRQRIVQVHEACMYIGLQVLESAGTEVCRRKTVRYCRSSIAQLLSGALLSLVYSKQYSAM